MDEMGKDWDQAHESHEHFSALTCPYGLEQSATHLLAPLQLQNPGYAFLSIPG
jgi:hypothetical protein